MITKLFTRLLESLLAAILYPLALVVYVLYWRPHEHQALSAAARCDPEALSPVWDEEWIDETEGNNILDAQERKNHDRNRP